MGRYSNYPTTIDDLKCLELSFLKRNGYLNQSLSGVITWSRMSIKTASISVRSEVENSPRIIVEYKYEDQPIKHIIWLTSINSNLGKGKIWYFHCAYTGKRCRKLHLINGHFIHRSALINGMYESQLKSKKWRYIERVYGSYFESDNCYQEIYSKHFKKFYKGRPTKRYQKLISIIKKSETLPLKEIEQFILG